MSSPFGGPARTAPGLPNLPTPPTGWPVGSYATYAEAQRAVDYLADRDFPVGDVTIVGVDLMLVERVHRPADLGARAALGGRVGRVVRPVRRPAAGVVQLGQQHVRADPGRPGQRCAFGAIFAAVGYGATRGRRDFTSASQMVAGRYDVLCQPRNAEKARELLAKLAMGPGATPAAVRPRGAATATRRRSRRCACAPRSSDGGGCEPVTASGTGRIDTRSVPRAFDDHAASYDKLVDANPGYHDHLRLSVQRMGLPDRGRGLRLLDVGCGTGASTAALLAVAPEAEIVAVDASAGDAERGAGASRGRTACGSCTATRRTWPRWG